MITFLIGVAILILGYFTYGKFVERVFGPDDRKTPALANPDGVDRVPMPHWKNVLIQLLNIAGIGPVIGVILGIKFGAIVFILLPLVAPSCSFCSRSETSSAAQCTTTSAA